jgi:ADP-heptose:LPS heptosyltransferase
MRTGQPCALYVKEAFRPLVELMPHAYFGPDSQNRPDISISTSWSSRVATQSWRLHARRRILLVNQKKHLRWWYKLVFHQTQISPMHYEYWAHYFWRVVGGRVEDFQSPLLNQPPEDWRHPDLPRGSFILINPTAAWDNKLWPAESWKAFFALGGIPDGLPCVMTGGSSSFETEHCRSILAGLNNLRVVDLSARTSLKQYLHALSRASMSVCVDGSASHLCQAFGVATLTMFGPSYPSLWHWPTQRHVRVSDGADEGDPLASMSRISPNGVAEKTRELFEGLKSTHPKPPFPEPPM